VIVGIRIGGRWVARGKRLRDRFVESCFPNLPLAFCSMAVGIGACRLIHEGLDQYDHRSTHLTNDDPVLFWTAAKLLAIVCTAPSSPRRRSRSPEDCIDHLSYAGVPGIAEAATYPTELRPFVADHTTDFNDHVESTIRQEASLVSRPLRHVRALRQFPSVRREQAIAALDLARESLLTTCGYCLTRTSRTT
jgi:hypothetical protein